MTNTRTHKFAPKSNAAFRDYLQILGECAYSLFSRKFDGKSSGTNFAALNTKLSHLYGSIQNSHLAFSMFNNTVKIYTVSTHHPDKCM